MEGDVVAVDLDELFEPADELVHDSGEADMEVGVDEEFVFEEAVETVGAVDVAVELLVLDLVLEPNSKEVQIVISALCGVEMTWRCHTKTWAQQLVNI